MEGSFQQNSRSRSRFSVPTQQVPGGAESCVSVEFPGDANAASSQLRSENARTLRISNLWRPEKPSHKTCPKMLNVIHLGCRSKNVNKNIQISNYVAMCTISHFASPYSTHFVLQRGTHTPFRKPWVTQLWVSPQPQSPISCTSSLSRVGHWFFFTLSTVICVWWRCFIFLTILQTS